MTLRSSKNEKQDIAEEVDRLRQENNFLKKQVAEWQEKESRWLNKIISLQNIVESPSAVSIMITDLQGNILLWNKGAENMLGYSAGEIINKKKISVLYPDEGDTREVVKEVVTHIINEKKGITCEVEELHKDGHKLWVRLTLSPRFNEQGEVIGILGIGENATERKQAEAALAERVTLAAFSAKIGNALVESASMRQVLTRCTEITSHYLGICLARVWIIYKGENVLEVQAEASGGLSSDPPVASGRMEKDPLGIIAAGKKPFLSNQASKDQNLQHYHDWLVREGIQGYGAYPLVLEQQVMGIFEVFSHKKLSEARHHTLATTADEITLGLDRVRTFDALQNSEERIRSIVNNSLEGLITFYRNGKIASFNPAAEKIFGYPAEEAIKNSLATVFPNLCDTAGEIKEHLLSGDDSLLGRLVEETGQNKQGNHFPVDLAVSEIKFPERRKANRSESGDRPSLYTAMVRDITQRKGFEEALRNERDYTMRIIERTPALVVGLGLDGTTRFVNPAVERTTGFQAGDLIGQNWWRTVLPGEAYKQTEALFDAMQKGPVLNHEIVLTARNKEKRVVSWSNIQRLGDQGQLEENIGFGTDVTEQKRVEKQLIAAARKAEESNRLKSDFLSIISHELRTPLTVMLGSTPLLLNAEDLPDPDEIVNISRDIDSSGKHLLALIDDLLDFSKVEAGKMGLSLDELSIGDFMEQLIPACQMIAQKKGLMIFSEVEDFNLLADKVRLKQIIFNLLSNAIKFTDEGSITVRVRKEQNKAVFEVEDTGCGISENDVRYIFDVFRQVDASTTRAASGTGLGLAITKELVELHQGTIAVESTFGKGSVFRFVLPLEPERRDN
ncbi:MAG: PAS domain S-box protein [Candidatus Nitronauta litoralis]|uniref:histidine kinase n=1 Tax=Candidatus Nitronauta litoralis TaxID=2705533 RepID=A0A7T0BVQ8_9BACT|nr:MAG: PAS domain S-box protein [Candidatus Nitronauta litoralis]